MSLQGPESPDTPQVGVDSWVAAHEERVVHGRLADLIDRVQRLPAAARYALLVVPIALFPLFVSSDYLMQVGVDTLIYMLLALGLNVALGFAGLLDLGYVAFFGAGAYMYALLASGRYDLHWQAQWAIPAAVAGTAVLGFLVGLPSRRLVGDYLAIVTLFFLQIFLVVLLNSEWSRGPNGISDVDPLSFFGWELTSLDDYFYVALAAFTLVLAFLYLLNESRTGRALRALREDPLAAELMTMPVNRLKLMAFAIGAGIGGLTGPLFAAQQGAVFPVDFDVAKLITLYAMVILGGVGSLAGVAIGAIAVNSALEALRTPEDASWLFFGLIILVLPFAVRPLARWAVLFAGTIAFGFAAHALADAFWERGTAGATPGGAWIDRVVDSWVLLPENPDELGRYAYLILVASILGLTLLRGWTRTLATIPVLYLAACVWENVMVEQPSVSRYILIGAMLVALMTARPQGLFGTTRVEIV